MSNGQNPYGTAAGGYTVQFGGEPARPAAASPNGPAGDTVLAPSSGDVIKDTTTAAFTADVIRESRQQPVLVDFWAPWCGPCKQLTPALEKAVRAAGGKVKLVKMNIDEHPSIAGQLGIQSIPAVIAFKNGQPVDGFMGAIPESQIAEFLKRVIGKGAGAEIADALAAATEARAAGDVQTAADIYSALLEQAPDNADAAAGLADLLFETGDEETARAVLGRVPEDKQDAPAVAAVRAKIKLAEEAAALGNPAELEARLARDPKDHQARFDLAAIRNAQGKRTEAAEHLLAIIKADRSWQDDAARQQLLKFFDAWGMTDEATLASRRKLSSILFS
jgi:putative thioredoxin